jgi:hypothetical protein
MIVERLNEAGLNELANRFLRSIGHHAIAYLKILPKYESDKMFQRQKAPQNLNLEKRALRKAQNMP